MDPTLKRWLKKLDLQTLDRAPDIETFRDLVQRMDRHLQHLQADRELLNRTLETTTVEMNELNLKMRSERDRLQTVMTAAAEALSVFTDVADDTSTMTKDASAAMTVARTRFAARLSEVVGEDVAMSEHTHSIHGLKSSFTALADQITFLVRNASDAASMRQQLEVAGAVQRMLVPDRDEQTFGRFELATSFQPAADCGGDWWTLHATAGGRTLLVVADVTGHGVPSAIITGAAKGATDLARAATRGKLTPGMLLRMLNGVITSASRRQYMMTAVALVLDQDGTVQMANAGHPPPLRLRGNEVRPLPTHRDPPLGSVDGHVFEESTVTLQPGDDLLIYTDGVTECLNPREEEFGERRLRSLLTRCEGLSPARMRDRVNDALELFADDAEQADDITFVALAYR